MLDNFYIFNSISALTHNDFLNYRRENNGPRTDAAFQAWRRNGGRDRDNFQWHRRNQRNQQRRQPRQEPRQDTRHIVIERFNGNFNF